MLYLYNGFDILYDFSFELEEFEIEANLISICNIGCLCFNNYLELICGINGIIYFFFCYAGCI